MKLKPELESLRVINLNKCLCAPQLQGNIRMHPKCILHVFQTHPACFMDASCASSGCVPHLEKGHGSYISLAAALLQSYTLAKMHFMCIPNAFHACPTRILHSF